ncbi:MAG: beta-lactamase family protein [Lewinellaceae bacterium]|nr:beta-lactamase family protein [Lewinellaceae bacterium]
MKWTLLLLFPFSLHAQPSDTTFLHRYFNQLEAKSEAMGSIAITVNGQAYFQKSIGWANLEQREQASAATRYRVGSVTKMFVATVMMQLVEAGKVSLDTKLAIFFPDVPYSNAITLAQLLRHDSGLRDKPYLKWQYYGKKYTLEKRPGYANVNYVLLAQIAEQLEGKPFAAILAERVFQPCRMTNSYYGSKPDALPEEALSYRKLSKWTAVPASDLEQSGGAGAVVSCPTDLNLFLDHLFSGHLVSASGLKEMENTVGGYGMGMMQVYYYQHVAYSHAGAVDGFQTRVFYFPAQKIAISYCSNGVALPIDELLLPVVTQLFGKE